MCLPVQSSHSCSVTLMSPKIHFRCVLGDVIFFSFRCVLFTLLFFIHIAVFSPLSCKKLILLSPHQAGGVGKLVNAVLEKEVT